MIPEEYRRYYIDSAYEWWAQLPGFLKAISGKWDTYSAFAEHLSKGELYAGKIDGKLMSLVHGEIKSEGVVEGHLYCNPESPKDYLISHVIYAKNTALLSYGKVITFILHRHKFLFDIMRQAGFIDTGIRIMGGVYRNKILNASYYLAE